MVRERAGDRCEYCGIAQAGQEATFHIDHIVPINSGGETDSDNLALACVSCSLRKGDRQKTADPVSGELVELFNPRAMNWPDNFRWDGVVAIGLTSVGRATVAALSMNRPLILSIRAEESLRGRHPPI
jgi:hypothetical protein